MVSLDNSYTPNTLFDLEVMMIVVIFVVQHSNIKLFEI